MRRAIALARAGVGRTSPNPSVGCVILNRDGAVAGEGATASGGRPHAETIALAAAESAARGGTAYVSFEPCAHRGKTPPCADALIEAGLKRVVVGCLDPYPPVRGRGVARLRKAGIEVTLGVLENECQRVNEGFITRVTRRRPFVMLKLAMTLDGRIATRSGDSRWISSEDSRELVHRWRAEYDAVMVGAGSVIADNPRLTCRIEGGRDPMRIIVDGRLRSPADAVVFSQRSSAITMLVTAPERLAKARRSYGSRGVEIVGVTGSRGEIQIVELMRELARRGCSKVMIEGGAHLAGAALRAGIVDRVAMFIAPKIIGGGVGA
ncbi:MAG: bifunctional diaminohydroxyphosphoribosylaminopyrimidine deaminase/5-amino-6-(5-phosphoribosylamino)uracil reductase RibD, partial [Candidatus Binataceae bacterium]